MILVDVVIKNTYIVVIVDDLDGRRRGHGDARVNIYYLKP